MLCMEFRFRKYRLMNIKYKCRLPRGVIQRWRFFSLAPFFNLNRLIKHHNILRNTNLNNRRNETNIDISLRVSNANHLKLVRIYLPNPVCVSKSIRSDYDCHDNVSGSEAFVHEYPMHIIYVPPQRRCCIPLRAGRITHRPRPSAAS